MTRSRLIIAAVAITVAVVVGGFVAYDQVLRGDSATALSFPRLVDPRGKRRRQCLAPPPLPRVRRPPPASMVTSPGPGTLPPAASPATASASSWPTSPAESDAVGRTDQVTGSITVESDGTTTTLTAADLTVDTTSLASDELRRDNRLRREGLETDAFPTATFTLTAPVEVPAAALTGTAIGRDPDRRPDAPRRDQVGPDPGPGPARRRDGPGGRLDHLPALGLRRSSPRTSAGSSSRSRTTARWSSWSTSARADRRGYRPRASMTSAARCSPASARMMPSACPRGMAARYGRSAVSASNTSATATIRAPIASSGSVSPRK